MLLLASPLAAEIQSGDLLINYFTLGGVEAFRPDGTRVMASGLLTGKNRFGVALTPDGLIATSYRSPTRGIDLIDDTGTRVRSFDTPEVIGLTGDVSVFSDGTLAFCDQLGRVELYDPFGVHVRTIPTPELGRPVGSWIDGNDHLWVLDDQTGYGTVARYDQSGTLLDSFATAFGLGDLVTAPDGTLWISGREDGKIYHLDAVGNVLGSFPAVTITVDGFFYGIALAPDGSLYAVGISGNTVYHYGPTGGLLGSFPVTGLSPTSLLIAGAVTSGIQGVPGKLSLSAGGSQVLTIDLDDALAGKSYQVLGSASGVAPGFAYGGVPVPLNVDPYFLYTLLNPNTPPLAGSGGLLDPQAGATTVFTLPPASDPSLAGLTIHHAAVVLDLVGGAIAIVATTDPAPLTLDP
jgi:sugar lactone lactonase YvrE